MNTSGSQARGTAPSTMELVRDVIDDFQSLMRQEVGLAKAEMRSAAAELVRASSLLVAAGVLGVLGFAYLTLAGFITLQRWLLDWAAALVVGGVLVVVGLVLGWIGLNAARHEKLRTTAQSLQEDQEWIRSKLA